MGVDVETLTAGDGMCANATEMLGGGTVHM